MGSVFIGRAKDVSYNGEIDKDSKRPDEEEVGIGVCSGGHGPVNRPSGLTCQIMVHRNLDTDPAKHGYRTCRARLNCLTRLVQVRGSQTRNRPCSLLIRRAKLNHQVDQPGKPVGLSFVPFLLNPIQNENEINEISPP